MTVSLSMYPSARCTKGYRGNNPEYVIPRQAILRIIALSQAQYLDAHASRSIELDETAGQMVAYVRPISATSIFHVDTGYILRITDRLTYFYNKLDYILRFFATQGQNPALSY